jgi:exodeoxyribonuclease X
MIRIFDVETTGIDPQEDRVVEIAAYDLHPTERTMTCVGAHLCKPGRAIPAEASAIHHITDGDVENAYQFAVVWAAHFLRPDILIYAAHNCAFEQSFIPTPKDVRWICTYKCALRAWPDAPKHTNQVLRYWRGVDGREGFDREQASLAHRAAPDAYVTAWLLKELIAQIGDIEKLVQWSTEPTVYTRLTFGKHRGTKLADVPVDYLRWMLEQRGMDPDWHHCANLELGRRAADHSIESGSHCG